MQGKRSKKFRGMMQAYEINFDFRPPYQVIVDGNFLAMSRKIELDLDKKLYRLFKERTVLFTTKCIKEELRKLGLEFASSYNQACGMKTLKCHHDFFVEPSLCIEKHVGSRNKGNYIVATQDDKLISSLYEIPRVSTL